MKLIVDGIVNSSQAPHSIPTMGSMFEWPDSNMLEILGLARVEKAWKHEPSFSYYSSNIRIEVLKSGHPNMEPLKMFVQTQLL